jgi:transglutaminase-like putative cysteine protease
MMLSVLLAVTATLAAPPAAGAPVSESARYRFAGPSPWKHVRAVENQGYRLVLSAPDGANLEATIEVDGTPLTDDAPFPPPAALLWREAQGVLADPLPPDPAADALAREVTGGSRGTLEAVERVIAYTARHIRYALPGPEPETAASCRRAGRGSCVGRSLLAADLLLRAGVPARQVTGVLVASDPSELTPESRAVYNGALGGVRHRWIEAFVPGLGWVPSDPGGLANAVTARHLALATQPPATFHVETLSRTTEMRRQTLPAGPGDAIVLGRERGSSVVVRNSAAPSGGSVVLAPIHGGDEETRDPPLVARTQTSSVLFERVPPGDYRVLWKSGNGRVEAASVKVRGHATVDLAGTGASPR